MKARCYGSIPWEEKHNLFHQNDPCFFCMRKSPQHFLVKLLKGCHCFCSPAAVWYTSYRKKFVKKKKSELVRSRQQRGPSQFRNINRKMQDSFIIIIYRKTFSSQEIFCRFRSILYKAWVFSLFLSQSHNIPNSVTGLRIKVWPLKYFMTNAVVFPVCRTWTWFLTVYALKSQWLKVVFSWHSHRV